MPPDVEILVRLGERGKGEQFVEVVKKGKALSPVLLVRGEIGRYPLVVADGYHRICASYHLDEDTEIPCRMVALST